MTTQHDRLFWKQSDGVSEKLTPWIPPMSNNLNSDSIWDRYASLNNQNSNTDYALEIQLSSSRRMFYTKARFRATRTYRNTQQSFSLESFSAIHELHVNQWCSSFSFGPKLTTFLQSVLNGVFISATAIDFAIATAICYYIQTNRTSFSGYTWSRFAQTTTVY